MPEVPAVPRNAGLKAGATIVTEGASGVPSTIDRQATVAETTVVRQPFAGSTLAERTHAAFAADGPLARAVADFEPRAGQLEMASAVADVIEHGGILLAEA